MEHVPGCGGRGVSAGAQVLVAAILVLVLYALWRARRNRPSHRHSPEYDRYMASPEWKRKRQDALRAARFRCQYRALGGLWRCPQTKGLQVHHRNYRNLWHEQADDLVVLCRRHHVRADRERRAETRRRSWR